MKPSIRRSFLKKSALGLSAWFGLSSFVKAEADPISGAFVHVVYFWMNNPDDDEEKALFTKNLKAFLDKVSVIRSYHVGTPANTPRDVVDNSYSFGLVVTFDDVAGHDIYQEHAEHKKFIAETQHLWSKVQIYDSIAVA
ncbi:MAG: Dabb family protein [Bacteroidota bacterium]